MRSLPTAVLLAAAAFLSLPATPAAAHAAAAGELPEIVAYVVPHSHDDPGWLHTADDYYTSQVHAILDSVTQALLADSNRTFTQVEIVYFSRWWSEQTNSSKAAVRGLVKNGQLDFSLGGWVMSDEATTLRGQNIDQMTEGMLWLKRELDYMPTAGWHIDPFGHAQATPSMLARMGLSAFGLNRLDWRKKFELMDARELEFVWRSDASLGPESDLWIHVLPFHYSTPGVNPWTAGDMVDNGQAFVDMLRARSDLYIHNHVMIPFGDDFNFQDAADQYPWMDQLIAYVNENATLGCKVKYSHLSEYAAAVSALNISWPCKTSADDFMLYTDHDHSFWTGFYSSHPHIKGSTRMAGRLLRSAEVMHAVAALRTPSASSKSAEAAAQQKLQQLRETVALMQHHDANTGTSKAAVVANYEELLANASAGARDVLATAVGAAVGRGGTTPQLQVAMPSELPAGADVPVVVVNDVGWARAEFLPIGTNQTDLVVVDAATGGLVPSQINPEPEWAACAGCADSELLAAGGPWTHRLYFLAELPPVGTKTYLLRADAGKASVGTVQPAAAGGANLTLSNRRYVAEFGAGGTLSALHNRPARLSVAVEQDLREYTPAWQSGQPSGAYVFRPEEDNRLAITMAGITTASWQFEAALPAASRLVVLLTPCLLEMRYPWAPYVWRDDSTFVLTTVGVSSSNFTLQSYTVDTTSSQTDEHNMAANFLVLDAAASLEQQFARGFKAGSTVVPPANVTATNVTLWLRFPEPFEPGCRPSPTGSNPNCPGGSPATRMLATARITGGDAADVLATVVSVRADGAKVLLTAVNSGPLGLNGSALAVDWLAWPASLEAALPAGSTSDVIAGLTELSLPSADPVQVLHVSLADRPDSSGAWGVADPATLVSALVLNASSGMPIPVAVTVTRRNAAGFTLLVACVTSGCSLPAGAATQVSWVAFRRRPWRSNPVRPGGLAGRSGPTVSVVRGPFVSEVRQWFGPGYAQTFRLFHLPANHTVAAVDRADRSGGRVELDRLELVHSLGQIAAHRELFSSFRTGLKTAKGPGRGTLWADENGAHLIEREFDLSKPETVAGNMWPMVQRAGLADRAGGGQLFLVGERAHAVSSHADGQMEVLLQRRTTIPDGFGTGETLDETQPVAPKFWLSLEPTAPEASATHRRAAALLESPPRPLFAAAVAGGKPWAGATETQGIGSPLPAGLLLQTLAARPGLPGAAAAAAAAAGSAPSVLLRLEHTFEAGEGDCSAPASIDVAQLLAPLGGLSVAAPLLETGLSANQPLAELDSRRLPFPAAGGSGRPERSGANGTVVELHAGEIRTFLL